MLPLSLAVSQITALSPYYASIVYSTTRQAWSTSKFGVLIHVADFNRVESCTSYHLLSENMAGLPIPLPSSEDKILCIEDLRAAASKKLSRSARGGSGSIDGPTSSSVELTIYSLSPRRRILQLRIHGTNHRGGKHNCVRQVSRASASPGRCVELRHHHRLSGSNGVIPAGNIARGPPGCCAPGWGGCDGSSVCAERN